MTTRTEAWTNPPMNQDQLTSWFHDMRTIAPVLEQPGREEWHIFGYAEARVALENHAALSNAVSVADVRPDSPFMLFRSGNLTTMDPPRHLHLRGLVHTAFSPFSIGSLQPMMHDVVDGVLRRVQDMTEVAFVAEIAIPIASRIAANIIGIPSGDDEQFRRWSAALLALTDPLTAENGMKAFIEETTNVHGYLHEYIGYRRAHPGDDLTSRLTQVDIDGAGLSDDEIAGLIALLMNTGVTSNQLLVNTMVCLDQQPAAASLVRGDPSLLPAFIEEVLRHRGQTSRVERFSTEDVVLGEYTIPAAQHVSVWLTAANRDPSRFPDPDVFDLYRSPNPHIGFGHGIHFCFGAALSRLLTAFTFTRLLAMTADLAVDYERSRLLDPRLLVGAAELDIRIRWGAGG
jgi:cytochrome P450